MKSYFENDEFEVLQLYYPFLALKISLESKIMRLRSPKKIQTYNFMRKFSANVFKMFLKKILMPKKSLILFDTLYSLYINICRLDATNVLLYCCSIVNKRKSLQQRKVLQISSAIRQWQNCIKENKGTLDRNISIFKESK